MFPTFRGEQVGLGLLLVTLSLGLFGCTQGLDIPAATTRNGDSDPGISTQGFQFDEELLGSERQAALEQAFGDWRVQGVRSLLESEGKQLELDRAQAFSFERGSHPGTVVLLPFGDRLLSYWQFRDRSRIMLAAYQPGAIMRAVNVSQERKDLLQEMLAKGAFRWLEEEYKKRSRVLVPGLTLLLRDDTQGIVVFFVFTHPRQPNSSGLAAQLVFLDPGVDGDAAGEIYLGDGTTSSSTAELDPGIGGGTDIDGYTFVSGSISHSIRLIPPAIIANIDVNGTHTSVTSSRVTRILVEGNLTLSGATPGSCRRTGYNSSSTTCYTSLSTTKTIPITGCTMLDATGTGFHSFSDPIKGSGSTSSFGDFLITFNC